MSQIGQAIYERFTTVALLKVQMRVTDPVWLDLFHALRKGEVERCHLDILDGLVLSSKDCAPTDFTSPNWNYAPLVTPGHLLREQWIKAAVEKHAVETGAQVYISPAEDRVGGRLATP